MLHFPYFHAQDCFKECESWVQAIGILFNILLFCHSSVWVWPRENGFKISVLLYWISLSPFFGERCSQLNVYSLYFETIQWDLPFVLWRTCWTVCEAWPEGYRLLSDSNYNFIIQGYIWVLRPASAPLYDGKSPAALIDSTITAVLDLRGIRLLIFGRSRRL
jgi:hypothetical protein